LDEIYRKHWDSVGRPRKLSAGAMTRVMDRFAKGDTVKELAQSFGVSQALIRTITYHTVRDADRDKITED
jgi:hypothetical protein